MNIILVHGIFDDSGIFKYMSSALRAEGHACFLPSLKPADAKLGIRDLAEKLQTYINQHLGVTEAFILVGFSMGCLVSRCYLQELGAIQRCVAFHAISGPHHGSWWAYAYWGQGAKDMRPDSALLNDFAQSEHVLADIPLFSYRTRFDEMIIPSKSSEWGIAQNHQVNVFGHRSMLRSQFVIHKISRSGNTRYSVNPNNGELTECQNPFAG